MSEPRRKMESEIRERIASFQASIEENERNGLIGSNDWMDAVTAKR